MRAKKWVISPMHTSSGRVLSFGILAAGFFFFTLASAVLFFFPPGGFFEAFLTGRLTVLFLGDAALRFAPVDLFAVFFLGDFGFAGLRDLRAEARFLALRFLFRAFCVF